MALNIKDEKTDRLARELASVTGESITKATRRALEERLDRLRQRAPADKELIDIIRRGRSRQLLDRDRTEDEIMGYDEDGLPS